LRFLGVSFRSAIASALREPTITTSNYRIDC
jgi:hypothetical protein